MNVLRSFVLRHIWFYKLKIYVKIKQNNYIKIKLKDQKSINLFLKQRTSLIFVESLSCVSSAIFLNWVWIRLYNILFEYNFYIFFSAYRCWRWITWFINENLKKSYFKKIVLYFEMFKSLHTPLEMIVWLWLSIVFRLEFKFISKLSFNKKTMII